MTALSRGFGFAIDVVTSGAWALELQAVTYAAKFFIGLEPIAIERLPFTVGREAEARDGAPTADE